MKWLYGLGILVAVLGASSICVYSFPITKVPTSLAMSNIEQRYLRQELSAEDRTALEIQKKWILGNQSSVFSRLETIRYISLAVCVVLLVTSIAGLVIESRKERAEPSATGNATASPQLER